MSRREKPLEQMRNSPGSVRFSQVEALLKREGFALTNAVGSHRMCRREGSPLVTVVRPHGKRETCRPAEIRGIPEVLEL